MSQMPAKLDVHKNFTRPSDLTVKESAVWDYAFLECFKFMNKDQSEYLNKIMNENLDYCEKIVELKEQINLMQAQQKPRAIDLYTPKDENILLITKSSIFIGYYDDGYWWESASGDTCYGEAGYCCPVQIYPTHWLPLPAPSEGGLE